jgi:hypothetical protein
MAGKDYHIGEKYNFKHALIIKLSNADHCSFPVLVCIFMLLKLSEKSNCY